MRIEFIAIGTELLTTTRVDTNSVWLAQRLASLGLGFHRKTVVGDGHDEMAAIFREALGRSDFIVCTGGLGPTFDDLTKETWAEVLEDELIEDASIRREIEGFYTARRLPMPSTNLKQALVPAGGRALHNPMGTAPGILWESPKGREGTRIVLLPGVPREMKNLWETEVEPILRPMAGPQVHTLRMLVGSAGESTLDMRDDPAAGKARPPGLDHPRQPGSRGTGGPEHESGRPRGRAQGLRTGTRHRPGLCGQRLAGGEGPGAPSPAGRDPRRGREHDGRGDPGPAHRDPRFQRRVPGGRRGLPPPPPRRSWPMWIPPWSRVMARSPKRSPGPSRKASPGGSELLGDWPRPATRALRRTRTDPPPWVPASWPSPGPGGTASQTKSFPGNRGDLQARTATWALDYLRRQIQTQAD